MSRGGGGRRWVVREGDPSTLGGLLARLGPDAPDALAEGRLFVGRARADATSHPLAPGDAIAIFAPRAGPANDEPRVLGSCAGLVAVFKPASLATLADHRGRDALDARLARLLGVAPSALHAGSRLDVGVSGVVLFATSAAARTALARARAEGTYERTYLALAPHAPDPERGTWSAPLGGGPDPRRRYPNGTRPDDARTDYEVVARAPGGAMLRVSPITGRTHQIRVHASHAGAALYGDRIYGGPTRVVAPSGAVASVDRVALHAFAVTLVGPRGVARFVAPIPDDLRALWSSLGGQPGAWGASDMTKD